MFHHHKDKQPNLPINQVSKVDHQNIHYSTIELEEEIFKARERMKRLEDSYAQASSDSSSEVQYFMEMTSKIKKKLIELDNKITDGCKISNITTKIERVPQKTTNDS